MLGLAIRRNTIFGLLPYVKRLLTFYLPFHLREKKYLYLLLHF